MWTFTANFFFLFRKKQFKFHRFQRKFQRNMKFAKMFRTYNFSYYICVMAHKNNSSFLYNRHGLRWEKKENANMQLLFSRLSPLVKRTNTNCILDLEEFFTSLKNEKFKRKWNIPMYVFWETYREKKSKYLRIYIFTQKKILKDENDIKENF